MPLRRLLSRVKFDFYLLALIATVAIAAIGSKVIGRDFMLRRTN